jgi:hypothetical protein
MPLSRVNVEYLAEEIADELQNHAANVLQNRRIWTSSQFKCILSESRREGLVFDCDSRYVSRVGSNVHMYEQRKLGTWRVVDAINFFELLCRLVMKKGGVKRVGIKGGKIFANPYHIGQESVTLCFKQANTNE